MKALLFLAMVLILSLTTTACSRKYQKYPIIDKKAFTQEGQSSPVERPARMLSGEKETEKFCEGQILFNKNAQKIAEGSLPALISQSCPGSPYLLNAKITYLWWTTLVYTRACVKVESFCPKKAPGKKRSSR